MIPVLLAYVLECPALSVILTQSHQEDIQRGLRNGIYCTIETAPIAAAL